MKSLLLKPLSVLLIGLSSISASWASPLITDWTYTLTGIWTTYQPSGVNISGDSKTLWWGVPVTSSNYSSLAITDPTAGSSLLTQISGTSPVPGTTGVGLTLTHTNNPIYPPSLTSAVLNATLNLTASAGEAGAWLGSLGALPALNYNILFTETTNVAPCAALSPLDNPCNDIFVQQSGFLNQQLTIDGNDYFINIFPTSGGVLGVLNDASCAAVVGAASSGCLGFTTIEGQANNLSFGFTISTRRFDNQVSEPGMLSLLGMGLAALALSGRRRKPM